MDTPKAGPEKTSEAKTSGVTIPTAKTGAKEGTASDHEGTGAPLTSPLARSQKAEEGAGDKFLASPSKKHPGSSNKKKKHESKKRRSSGQQN